MIQEHGQLVYRVAYSVVRNAAEAEDVAQESFLQICAMPAAKLLSGEIEDERAYLAQIAWRLAVRRRKKITTGVYVEVSEVEVKAKGGSPEQAAIESQLESWLYGRIDALPEKLRGPLVLSALGELTSPQIALVLKIPEGTVRRRIHTAREMLRTEMQARRVVR
jgi:RNA polymerase sigma-70 factor (ECF subfamily)